MKIKRDVGFGVPLEGIYARITSMQFNTLTRDRTMECQIEVSYYINQESRDFERAKEDAWYKLQFEKEKLTQDALDNYNNIVGTSTKPALVLVFGTIKLDSFINTLNYDKVMTSGYEYLKTFPEFEGAENV